MTSRANEVRRRYGLFGWERRADVGDERVYFRGFRVRERDLPVWTAVNRRRVLLPDGIWLDRAGWMLPGDAWQRLLLVESYEAPSRAGAEALLVELLAQFQVPPSIVPIADGRGGRVLVDLRGGDTVVVVGNVVVRVGNGGVAPAPAPAVADHVRTTMVGRPPASPVEQPAAATARRRAMPARAVVGHPTPIEVPFTAPSRARRAGAVARAVSDADQDRYVKVFSRNGEVRTDEDDRVVFVPDVSGEAVLELYDVHGAGADVARITVPVDEPS